MTHSRRSDLLSTLRRVLLCGLAGFAILGCLLGGLTLRLNPRLASDASDAFLLTLYFVLGYALIGLFCGALAGGLVAALRLLPLPTWLPRRLEILAGGMLLLLPTAYFLLLPDVGVSGDLLTELIFNSSRPVQLGMLALLVTILLTASWLLARLSGAAARRLGTSRQRLVTGAAIAVFALAACWTWLGRVEPERRETIEPPAAADLEPAFDSPPLYLLCVDGADLQVIEPLVEAGELPTFARLMREGTWGELATLEPTRSPNIWTSMITGKPPEDHGIRHFVAFRFPGLRHPVEYFPRHTGLNFQIIPRLEALPGFPPLQAPYTSRLRLATPLWQIVGQHAPVGLYRWLVTWPAEPVNGFNIAASVAADAMQLVDGGLQENGRPLSYGVYSPPELEREIRRQLRQVEWREDDLQVYVGDGHQVADDHPKLAKVREAMNDPTALLLPYLIERFEPHFLAAGFYPVDSFQHYFSTARGSGGPFSVAIEERYRHTDARLAEFLAILPADAHVVVVSDHGFDFEHHHHSEAPPGIFIARGPAFAPGRRVSGLSIYDLAPLTLHLLGLPLAEDMAGTKSGTYRRALSEDYLQSHRVGRIPSYEFLRPADEGAGINPREEDIRRELKNLGYIN